MSFNEWIVSGSPKASEIKYFLENQVIPWKHSCGLSGQNAKYDFFLGCYGNPDADVVFIAEIPNFGSDFAKCPEDPPYFVDKPWKLAWNFPSRGDRTLRSALRGAGFIPDGKDDEPGGWMCWVTDVVKCAETIGEWETMTKREKGITIVRESMDLLKKELSIINPKVIVLMGKKVQNYYRDFKLENSVNAIDINTRHYSRIISNQAREMFNRRISKIGNLLFN